MTRDLDHMIDVFDAIDKIFFFGQLTLDGVRVKWMRFRKTKTAFVYAQYDFDRKRIELNPVLRHEWVPEILVMATIWHECLHAQRGFDHDDAFRLIEKSFPHTFEAEAWCGENHERMMNAEPPRSK